MNRTSGVVLASIMLTLVGVVISGGAWDRQTPAQDPGELCSPVYVVNAGEIKLCQDICAFRKAEGLKEIYRGARASLECVCETAKFNISGRVLGKGPQQ